MRAVLNRASSVYLCIFAVFVIGIWLILQFGSLYLTAPRDLAGQWRLAEPQSQATHPAFTIHQSGRYFRFIMENQPPLDLVLANAQAPADVTGAEKLTLAGQGWQVTVIGPAVADNVKFMFQPPASIEPPWTGTYRHERIGQPLQSPTQLNPLRQPAPSQNARE